MSKVSVYLAHNFSARDWLNSEVVPDFLNAGIDVTANWIWNDLHTMKENQEGSAIEDCNDVARADYLVLFIDQFGETPGRGKYFEFGYAVALDKPVILVGSSKNCVFYNLPELPSVATYQDAIDFIITNEIVVDNFIQLFVTR
jgi:nucleoside 2-deoxyribosyltransferase